VLITDIDIMLMAEDSSIIDQHAAVIIKDGTVCYENWVTGHRSADQPRMPGVHFVSRDWWARTQLARALISGEIPEGSTVTFGVENETLVIRR
jgi:hypothetical protein